MSLIQPLNVAINKPFKDLICENTNMVIFQAETIQSIQKCTVYQHHILTTSGIGKVFYRFYEEKKRYHILYFLESRIITSCQWNCRLRIRY
ncbi:hypothetical protein L873DRAFT_914329 [Choiromyces venosus 120613-1]|uniref:Uncharacterized protein n=1 Tax=Choiromyces venosus 120613-1 TaxID=1336337 RepID=A0A3N4JR02_9PEZI|nr:hypothetical protein L873DRAFT_914329 [Choiromyces venosus 120613-1]